jgi:hypothetical protein
MILVEEFVDITQVEVVGDHLLRLTFADGTVGVVDFAERRWRGVLEPLNDPAYFARVAVDPEAGTICWPNGADMAPEPLYAEARQGRRVAPTAAGSRARTTSAPDGSRSRTPLSA